MSSIQCSSRRGRGPVGVQFGRCASAEVALIWALLVVSFHFVAGCSQPDPADRLSESIHQLVADYPEATVAVSVRDLGSGLSFDMDADRVFHAASTMKVPVMIEVFRLADEGRLNLDDSITVANSFKSIVDGSPYSMDLGEDSADDVYQLVGKKTTIRWLVERMIAASSNLATNILVDLVAADSIQATIERLGTTTMHVYRGVEDLKAYEQGLNNTATSADLATLMTAVARGLAVSDSADAAMVEIMATQEFNTMIPSGLPHGTKVAHKTGSITRIHHDAAIVYPEDRDPYVLVILTEGIDDREISSKLGASIARLVHEQAL